MKKILYTFIALIGLTSFVHAKEITVGYFALAPHSTKNQLNKIK